MIWIINRHKLWICDHPPILKDGGAQDFIMFIVCHPEFSPPQP
jgi:hypothetical protein